MTNVLTIDRNALRRALDGTASHSDFSNLGIDTLLAAFGDPENVVRAPLEALTLTRAAGDASVRSIPYVMSSEIPVGPQRNLILQRGWDLTDFAQRGAPFLFDHNMTDANAGLPLGNMSEVRVGRHKGHRALMGVGNFTPEGMVPFTDMVFELADKGWLRGFSVGFRAQREDVRQPTDQERERHSGFGEYSLLFERATLMEGSVTAVGQDPTAVKLRSGLASGVERGVWRASHADAFLQTLCVPQGRSFVPMTQPTTGTFGAGVQANDSSPAVVTITQADETAIAPPPIALPELNDVQRSTVQALIGEAVAKVREECRADAQAACDVLHEHFDEGLSVATASVEAAQRSAELATERAEFATAIFDGPAPTTDPTIEVAQGAGIDGYDDALDTILGLTPCADTGGSSDPAD